MSSATEVDICFNQVQLLWAHVYHDLHKSRSMYKLQRQQNRCGLPMLRHQDISALEIGGFQGPVAQWLEYLAYIVGEWGGPGFKSPVGHFIFIVCHTRTARAETTVASQIAIARDA